MWQAQTIAKSQYEVILVMPPDFPAGARDKLALLLSARDRIEHELWAKVGDGMKG